MKVVSLVPSITELLFTLGLNDEVTGLTKFCVHPRHWLQTKTIIGGTKNVYIEKVKALQPTLIIANKEENVKEQVEELAKVAKLLLTDVNNYDEALQMISAVASAVNKTPQASKLISQIQWAFASINITQVKTAAYLIWKDPYMTVGSDTFISDMMRRAGYENVFDKLLRYPQITIADIKERNPQYVLLSSEPYPFQQKHVVELQELLPYSKFILADGEMFSWYGSRMLLSADYFSSLP